MSDTTLALCRVTLPFPGMYGSARHGRTNSLGWDETPDAGDASARHAPRTRQQRRLAKLAQRAANAPVDPADPEQVRQLQRGSGPTAVMRDERVDPDDIRPNAQSKPRVITHWRTACALRRMYKQRGSSITREHVLAGDELRKIYDVGRLGFSAGFDMVGGVNDVAYGPRQGPSKNAQRQEQAARDFSRAMRMFRVERDRRMIYEIVLDNNSIAKWIERENGRTGEILSASLEMGALIAILRNLVEHFGVEIDRGVKSGRVLEPV